MTGPVVGVLALQGDVREHLAALREAGAEAVPVRRPEELDTAQGGGVIFNQAPHQVDVVRLLGGGLPGITNTMTVIMVLPFTFGLEPLQGLACMVGVYVGGESGGLITSTFLTLIVVPVIYTLMEAVSRFGTRMAGWFGSSGGAHHDEERSSEERAAAE